MVGLVGTSLGSITDLCLGAASAALGVVGFNCASPLACVPERWRSVAPFSGLRRGSELLGAARATLRGFLAPSVMLCPVLLVVASLEEVEDETRYIVPRRRLSSRFPATGRQSTGSVLPPTRPVAAPSGVVFRVSSVRNKVRAGVLRRGRHNPYSGAVSLADICPKVGVAYHVLCSAISGHLGVDFGPVLAC